MKSQASVRLALWAVVLAAAGLLSLLLFAGCQWGGNLDRAQFDAHQKYYDASDGLLAVATQFGVAADQMAGKKHQVQAQYDTDAWERWVAVHTGPDGQVKASATQLTEAVAALETRRAKQRESEAIWARVSMSWRDTLVKFTTLNTTLRAKDVEWQKAKEDASAALDAAIKTLAGVAMGIGVTAAF